jgi:hypothetical protein
MSRYLLITLFIVAMAHPAGADRRGDDVESCQMRVKVLEVKKSADGSQKFAINAEIVSAHKVGVETSCSSFHPDTYVDIEAVSVPADLKKDTEVEFVSQEGSTFSTGTSYYFSEVNIIKADGSKQALENPGWSTFTHS